MERGLLRPDQITGFDDADLLILGKVLGNSKPAIALESQNLILNPELAGLKVLIRISVSTFNFNCSNCLNVAGPGAF